MTRKYYSLVLYSWAEDADLNAFPGFSPSQIAVAKEVLGFKVWEIRRLPKLKLGQLCRQGPFGHLTSDEWDALQIRAFLVGSPNPETQWL